MSVTDKSYVDDTGVWRTNLIILVPFITVHSKFIHSVMFDYNICKIP